MHPVPIIMVLAALASAAGERTTAPADPVNANVTETTKSSSAPPRDDQAVVCKRIEVTGTRFTTRECHTRAEWAAMTADARSFTDKMTTSPCMAGCRGR